ncbi:MAG: hypothetical protein ACE5DM_00520 [Candidatus Nanoarchaeia archaeon]
MGVLKYKKAATLLKVAILFILTLALASIAYADVTPVTFTIEATPVTDKILEDGSAVFDVALTNLQDVPDTFRFMPLEDVKWTPQFVPVTGKVQTLDGKESSTVRMYVKPSNVPRGMHNIKLTAESQNSKTRYDTIMKIWVGPHPSMYDPDVDVSVSVPKKLDPNQEYDVKVTLRNKNIIDLKNVQVSVKGKLVSSEQEVSLGPEEEKVVSVAIILPDDIEPTTDTLMIEVKRGEEVFYSKAHSIEVTEYLPPFTQNVTVEKRFLKTVRTIVLKHDGNSFKESPVKLETTRRLDLFTKTIPKAEFITEDGREFYQWTVALEPGDEQVLIVKTSYRGLALLIMLAILAYILYLFLKNPIEVSKTFRDVSYEDGTIREAKVVIHVKNRSSKTVRRVHIIERLPQVIGVKKGSFKHTLEPTKAYPHRKEGTVLEYEIASLEPKEERLISYGLKSKMHIIGSVTIKPTIVKFKGASGHTEKSYSSEIVIPGQE